jgi:hypothetical protein
LKTNLGKGNFIFVGSSNDLFAASIPAEWVFETLDHCDKLTANIYSSLKTRLDLHGLSFTRLQRNQLFALPLKATVFIPNLWVLPCIPHSGR